MGVSLKLPAEFRPELVSCVVTRAETPFNPEHLNAMSKSVFIGVVALADYLLVSWRSLCDRSRSCAAQV